MDEINRMSMLTAEFLQFSKPHVTHYKIQTIESCISRVISLLDSEITRLGHQIGFKDEGHGVCMFMDQDKMLQLLLNLVKNALELCLSKVRYIFIFICRTITPSLR